jgi:Fic family protein
MDLKEKASLLFQVSPLPDGRYLHWDQLRHRTPPEGLTSEEWWTGVKLARGHLHKPVPLLDKDGKAFWYGLPDPVLRGLHEIDQSLAGQIQLAEEVTNPASRDRYIVASLLEESITSSQLEGASTTTDVAKNMIRSGRLPSDRSEQMILNNYHAMQFVQKHAERPLSREMILELHRVVTKGTLNEDEVGTTRGSEDRIVIQDSAGNLLHTPPTASELPSRLDAMCAFANAKVDDTFVHPVVRAIILHFWIGYDHPFVDGNGRTARALFYWSMLSRRYWLAEYITISRIIKKAPGQYSRAFLYTETDDNDLTYFIEYQLSVILRAIEELQAYLRRKMQEIRQVEALLRRSVGLNHRQLAVLSHALKHPGMRYTIQSHRRSHDVVYQTARTDLLNLSERDLLTVRKMGKSYVFSAPSDLSERLQRAR